MCVHITMNVCQFPQCQRLLQLEVSLTEIWIIQHDPSIIKWPETALHITTLFSERQMRREKKQDNYRIKERKNKSGEKKINGKCETDWGTKCDWTTSCFEFLQLGFHNSRLMKITKRCKLQVWGGRVYLLYVFYHKPAMDALRYQCTRWQHIVL